MSEQLHACVACGEPATNGLGPEPIRWYCWLHDEHGDVPPVRAAWRRYNHARNVVADVLDAGERPTPEEIQEREDAMAGIEAVIRASERERYAALVEAARKAKHHPTFCILRMPTEGCVCGVNALASALAALEEAGSA